MAELRQRMRQKKPARGVGAGESAAPTLAH